MKSVLVTAACLSLLGPPAFADSPTPAPDKSGYWLFKPTPGDQVRALCTDRPTKSTGPCTVDAGHWQVESDLYNVTSQDIDGLRTTTELFTNPTLKIGVSNSLDLEVNIAPYEQITTKSRSGSAVAGGVGDLYLRAKQNLLGDDAGDVAVAISPFLKVPTAGRALGDGAVEGGVTLPVQFNLAGSWQLLFDPELDVMANASGAGDHLNATGLICISRPVSKTLTLSGELWIDVNQDPAGRTTQSSADVGVAYVPTARPDLQLDAGVNAGLNRLTPATQLYVGISRRF